MPKISNDPAKQAVWDIQTTHPDLDEDLDEALREIIDPEIGLNILELGLVRNITINEEENSAHVEMIMTTPFCPYAPAILESTRSKVESVIEMGTTIEMGMKHWDASYMEEGTGAEWGLF